MHKICAYDIKCSQGICPTILISDCQKTTKSTSKRCSNHLNLTKTLSAITTCTNFHLGLSTWKVEIYTEILGKWIDPKITLEKNLRLWSFGKENSLPKPGFSMVLKKGPWILGSLNLPGFCFNNSKVKEIPPFWRHP